MFHPNSTHSNRDISWKSGTHILGQIKVERCHNYPDRIFGESIEFLCESIKIFLFIACVCNLAIWYLLNLQDEGHELNHWLGEVLEDRLELIMIKKKYYSWFGIARIFNIFLWMMEKIWIYITLIDWRWLMDFFRAYGYTVFFFFWYHTWSLSETKRCLTGKKYKKNQICFW